MLLRLVDVAYQDEIVAIAQLTREDVRRVGSSLNLVFKVEDAPRFESLLKALDDAERKKP